MLTRVGETDDFVKVLDFGIVKLEHMIMSLTGSIVGTPPYICLNSGRGSVTKEQIYSLGIIMYEMLTGESPFKGDQITLMNKHLNERPQPLRRQKQKLKNLQRH